MRSKKLKGLLIAIILGVLLFFSIVTSIGYFFTKEVPIGEVEYETVKTFDEAKDYGEELDFITQEDYLKNKPTSEEALALFQKYGRGTLLVEDINLIVPVYEGFNSGTEFLGVGTANQNQSEGVGNFTLMGHNMFNGTIFTSLPNADIGTRVLLTDFKNTYTYRIVNRVSVDQSQGELMNDPLNPIENDSSRELDNKLRTNYSFKEDYLKKNTIEKITKDLSYTPLLTLITCNGGVGTTLRWVVTAELEKVEDNKELSLDDQTSLSLNQDNEGTQETTVKKLKVNSKLDQMNILEKLYFYFISGLEVIGLKKTY